MMAVVFGVVVYGGRKEWHPVASVIAGFLAATAWVVVGGATLFVLASNGCGG